MGGRHMFRCTVCNVLGYRRPVAAEFGKSRMTSTAPIVVRLCGEKGCGEPATTVGTRRGLCEKHRHKAG